jgi:hypothetical protein
MTIDIESIKSRLNDAYCGYADYEEAISGACIDVGALLGEVARLHTEVARERTSVVRFLREQQQEAVENDDNLDMGWVTKAIERGEHRREEEE